MTCGFQDIMINRYFKCKFTGINSEMKLLHQISKIQIGAFPIKISLLKYNWSVVHVYFFSGT